MTERGQEFLERFRSFKEFRVIGKSVQGVDAIEKALGTAKYTTDYLIENLLQVKVLRSMHPHAKILHVYTEDANKLEGVNAVLTASDIPGVNDAGYVIPDQPLLAGDRVRYLGDGVALVAADSVEKATEALRLIRVDYEPLEGVFNPLDAMKPECARIHEGGNIAASLKLRKGSVEGGFASADVTVEREYRTQFQEHAYLEPEAGIAIPEPDGSVTIMGSMQCPYNVQTTVAKVLNFPLDRVRVIQATTGGGFGGKEDVSSEVCARAALVSYRTKKPSLLAHTREDSIIGHSKRHPYIMRYKYGAKKNGRLTAAQIRIISDTGAYASLGPLVLARSVIHATGPYDVANVNVDAYCVYTNNTYAGAFRGFGNPQVHFAAESMMDELAQELRMDPLEFRMKNILRVGSRTCTDQELTESVGLEECGMKVARSVGWKEKRKNLRRHGAGVKRRGLGIALMYHGNSIAPEGVDYSAAVIRVFEDGKVSFRTGLTDFGQGSQTSLVQIVAETLGIRVDDVHLEGVDTSQCPDAGPTVASRTVVMGGNAALVGGAQIRAKMETVAAGMLGCAIDDITIQEGRVTSREDDSGSVTFADVAKECYRRGIELGYSGQWVAPASGWNKDTGLGRAYFAYTFGAVAAEVEVDVSSGETRATHITAAYDVGRAVNPRSIESVVEGASTQGVGYALMEEIVHDSGRILNPNLGDYYIPTAVDAPRVKTIIVEHPTDFGPFGAKGMGEPPIVAVAPAVLNAIAHATGARVRDLPATPERVFFAIKTRTSSSRSRR